jgi:hypothetical protein
MSDPNWQTIKTAEVLAQPKEGYWTLAIEYVNPSQRLKFVVDEITVPLQATSTPATSVAPNPAVTLSPSSAPSSPPPATPPTAPAPPSPPKWSYAPERKCTADGDPRAPFNPATCLFPDAPPGALIAKIGGSKAGKTDGTKIFVVGSYCVIELDDKMKGPLYLTMNSDPMSSLERSGSLQVAISQSA